HVGAARRAYLRVCGSDLTLALRLVVFARAAHDDARLARAVADELAVVRLRAAGIREVAAHVRFFVDLTVAVVVQVVAHVRRGEVELKALGFAGKAQPSAYLALAF